MSGEPARDLYSCHRTSPPAWISGILWAIVLLSLLFVILVFFLKTETYRDIGNTAEVLSALFCMSCCLYAYRHMADRVLFSLAAFAFFSYALANIFWYIYTKVFTRTFVYTSVSEIGFFCFFLFFIAAITIEFPRRHTLSIPTVLLLMVTLVAVPLVIIGGTWDNRPLHLLVTAFRFLLIEQLIEVIIRHGIYRYPVLFAGFLLHCAADLGYGIRETLVLNTPGISLPGPISGSEISLYNFLSIVGPLTICSFGLITIGLFSYLRQDFRTGDCSDHLQ